MFSDPKNILFFCNSVAAKTQEKISINKTKSNMQHFYVMSASLIGGSGAVQIMVTVNFSSVFTWVTVFWNSHHIVKLTIKKLHPLYKLPRLEMNSTTINGTVKILKGRCANRNIYCNTILKI